MKKKLKLLTTLIILIPWSVIIPVVIYIIPNKQTTTSIKANQPIKIIIPKKDTIPKFFNKLPKEGLKEALKYYNIEEIDIIYAQAILETGNFKSKHCIKNNNLFGLYNSKKHKYYYFNHWTESVIAYNKWIYSKYKHNTNYYTFLEKLGYCGSNKKKYTKILKQIVKNEQKRDTTRNTKNTRE